MSWVRGAPFSFMLFKKQTEKETQRRQVSVLDGQQHEGAEAESPAVLRTWPCSPRPLRLLRDQQRHGSPRFPLCPVQAELAPQPWPLAPKCLQPGLDLLGTGIGQGEDGGDESITPSVPRHWCSSTRLLYREAVNLFATSPLGCKIPSKPWFQHAATFVFHHEAPIGPALPGAHCPIQVLGLTETNLRPVSALLLQ